MLTRKLGGPLSLLLCMTATPAVAEIGTIDDVPAATLLLPYFEVDLVNPEGITTLFSINNATQSSVLAHVTLWTDMSIPTFDFDVYLTGLDVQTINLRDIFVHRTVPRTADAGLDVLDTISPRGILSQDINYPGSTGPCGAVPYSTGQNIPESVVENLRLAHSGQQATVGGITACFGGDHGDSIARGYVTVDAVRACNLSFPGDAGYATTQLASQNALFGDYFYVDPTENFAQGETLVGLEACAVDFLGDGIPFVASYVKVANGNELVVCPFDFAAGNYSFYGRYVGAPAGAGQDQREPLATTFASRYVTGGPFDGGTDLIVWRDSKTAPTGANGPFNCALTGPPGWYPLNQSDVVAFDEQENPEDRCFTGDIFSPPSGGEQTCFPLEAGRYDVATGNALAAAVNPTANFGWLYLNLNHTILGDPFPGVAQAWVTTVMSAEGRFSVGFDAIKLDSALTATPGGILFSGGGPF